MIFKIQRVKDNFLEEVYKNAMFDLNIFFELKWIYFCPRIIIIDDRKTFDELMQKKTERWVVGWSENRNVFLLNKEKMEKESSHKKYSEKAYEALIKHELTHSFFNVVSGYAKNAPKWLTEGIAIYLSKQNQFKKRPIKLKNFLEYYYKSDSGMYYESGFVIELLIKNFGKKNFLNLIKSLKNIKTKKDFDKLFKIIYGFGLSYKKFNVLLLKK
jgi:hypothetical protein